ncbi:MAG: AmmeMemoRadiSam system protein A [Coriobacteriia bacterium]|nr:AmmeMemoRadiSam system protein A [Coriobacteriia bacterium]
MPTDVFGVISPHPPIFVPDVGGREAHVAQASLDALETGRAALARFAPETIVLMSPHAPAAADAFIVDVSDRLTGSLEQFGARKVYSWPGDPELARAIVDGIDAADIPAITRDVDDRLRPGWLDHASIVPLSFLEPTESVRLVILSLSYRPYAEHRRVGEIVRQAAENLGRRVAFLASGDMSHRLKPGAAAGYSPRAVELDAAIEERVAAGRFSALMELDPDLVEAGGECGLRSLITLGGFAGDDPVRSKVLAYEGPWGVGYLTALVGDEAIESYQRVAAAVAQTGRKGGMAGTEESEIVSLARETIEAYVRDGTVLEPAQLAGAEYPERAGAFVSLHRLGMLRGCIGTISPTRPTLAQEVAANAIQAATEDPRFPSLGVNELADLEVKVDVLHAPEACTLDDLDPKAYGVIVTRGYRRGLLLPDLEGVDDVASQVAIAMQKAGLPPDSQCDLQRFKVDRYT